MNSLSFKTLQKKFERSHSLFGFFSLNIRNVLLFLFLLMGSARVSFGEKWIGTWGCAPYAAANNTPPSPFLENNSLRQIVRVSIGGDTLRIRFSNITSSSPVSLNAVTLAVLAEIGGSAIDASTLKPVTFNGNASYTMEAYSDVVSDPLAFPLSPGAHLAITIHYGACRTAADMTHHYGSRTDSYILVGDQTQNTAFAGATRIERWYHLNTIEVLAPEEAGAVVALGNSITDGYGLHGGLNNRWTDKFSEKLLANPATSLVSVVNMGIGATWLTTSGMERFRQDVLEQNALRWIIVFYGVNDIGGGASASTLINAFKSMIAQAHAENIRIYGATITPFKGSGYYSAAHEAVRTEVNEWIRTPGHFDQCLDFDQIIRDPSDPEKLQEAYSNDWLHPNAAGYQLLGESIDLNLFLGGDTLFDQPEYTIRYFEPECANVGSEWKIAEDAQASNNYYVTVKAGVQSKDNAPAAPGGLISLTFQIDTSDHYNLYARLNCPSPDDDSFWLKMDEGSFAMHNGLGTSNWQWLPLGSFSLEKGEHTLALGYREDGAKLDKFCISNAPYPPSGKGEEAENLCLPEIGDNSIHPFREERLKIFPNPSDTNMFFQFRIEHPSEVKLHIYDIQGRKVATLVDEKLHPGEYTLDWEASSGHFMCQFIAGETLINKKILLLN